MELGHNMLKDATCFKEKGSNRRADFCLLMLNVKHIRQCGFHGELITSSKLYANLLNMCFIYTGVLL